MPQALSLDSPVPAVTTIAARQWLTLALVLCGPFMTLFDFAVVNVAIPTVQRDLHASFAQVQFVIAGYALAFAVTLITGGRLGDIYGRKRLFMLGMTGFTLASALCGFAPSPDLLIGARIVQGFAGALMTPQVLSIIQVTFTPEVRSRALGIYGAVIGIAATLGQVLGGLIIRADLFGLSWRPIFLVNLPVGIAALAAATFLLAESRSVTARRLDLGGVCIVTLGLFLLTYPLVAGREAGWPPWTWLCLFAALPVLVAFVAFERWVTSNDGSPLVVLRLFRLPAFVAGLRVQFAFTCANAAFLFTLALYLQLGLHFSALRAGLTFGLAPIAVLIVAPLAGKLPTDLGRRLIVSGIALMIAGWIAIVVVVHFSQEMVSAPVLASLIFVQGAGAGLALPRVFGAVLAGIDRDDAGSASGLLSTFQQVGGGLGVAAIGVIFFGVLAGHAPGVSDAIAPELAQRLATTSVAASGATTVAAFRACADDRARSHDPAISPASCGQPELHPSDPAVASLIAAFMQRANVRNYANAYIVGMLCATGGMMVALISAFRLPAPRGPRGG